MTIDSAMSVIARLEPRVIPTYPVGTPEKNPVFFEKRVYQGSCGKVYPVPFIDKVFDEPADVTYQSALLENEFVRLVMLPEIGGRIFIGQDKTNHDYDFFYRQDVIKPALVGLAGPWISGGVEFNWPQHHRPGTFMPADVSIEHEPDGAKTVWLSEHDPLNRLKGMHGIRLRPGSSLIELRARLYNRTPFTQTFLWWANVAAMVHDQYQSFFPTDVRYVADHAVRAMSSFPDALNHYYGVAYHERPGANDLTWYENIPVPTSYMVCQTAFDFFGGYDFSKQGGFVHVANRHIAPGKKQWTWGNHDFGWAWDRELTDENGPYIELMAGVYTDNQPDFSYLSPFETRTFSQFWWPIQGIGPVQQANRRAALRLVVGDDLMLDLGVCVSENIPAARIVVTGNGTVLLDVTADLSPGHPWHDKSLRFTGGSETELLLTVSDADGSPVISHRPIRADALTRDRAVATEPVPPEDMLSADELYFTGEHLEQYRHPTRNPESYWNEALRRDPGDARCLTALGRRALNKGLFDDAAAHLANAIKRLTSRHPNPVTGEAHYFLGLTYMFLGDARAYATLYKATWNHEWRCASYYLLACLDCRKGDFASALEHLEASLDNNRNHNKAHVLKAAILRRTGRVAEAKATLESLLSLDPLDHWAGYEKSILTGDAADFLRDTRNDAQTILDIVFDYADAGFNEEAVSLLGLHHANPVAPCAVPNPLERTPMTSYALAWLCRGDRKADAAIRLQEARMRSPDRFFPSRLHEQLVLEWALAQSGNDPVAAYAIGNYFFDLKRHEDAITAWERSLRDGAEFATVHRNLGIAYWNIRRDGPAARASYVTALALDQSDPRILSEFDQLRKKLNEPLQDRLAYLEARRELVLERDDCTVELASLHNLLGQPGKALELITSRRFHPWEGGEGSVLRQYTTARVALGRQALAGGRAAEALEHFAKAMDTPQSLGEAYHLLQAKADVNYWLAKAHADLNNREEAAAYYHMSASESGDFAEMAVTAHSPLSYFRGLSLRELGRDDEARKLFLSLKSFAESKLTEPAKIDYFATSLPNLLVFEEDLQSRRDAEFHLLVALACHGLGYHNAAKANLEKTLAFTNADQRAADLAAELS